MNYKCVDRGSLRCPCALMEAGQCYTCNMSRKGKCDCSIDWQGVCPYNEFLQGGGVPAIKGGLPEEFTAEVLSVKKYSDQLAAVRLGVGRGFARRCRCPGSFVMASALGCRVPLSVLQTGWGQGNRHSTGDCREDTQCIGACREDTQHWDRGWIEIAVQPAGPKTKELLKSCSKEGACDNGKLSCVWKISGPFEAGLLNRERLRAGEPLTVIAKGAAIAPFINMKESFLQGTQVKLLVDDDKLKEDFLVDYLADCPWEKVSLAEDEGKILDAIDEAAQVMLLASPYYTERFLGMRLERKDDIITANHANMCCGAGICGACSYTDKYGVTVRRCRCVD